MPTPKLSAQYVGAFFAPMSHRKRKRGVEVLEDFDISPASFRTPSPLQSPSGPPSSKKRKKKKTIARRTASGYSPTPRPSKTKNHEMNIIMEKKGKVEGDKRKEASSVFEESDVEVSPVNPVSSRPQKKKATVAKPSTSKTVYQYELGPLRDVPCLRCVRSAINRMSPIQCHDSDRKRCVGCVNMRLACEPLPDTIRKRVLQLHGQQNNPDTSYREKSLIRFALRDILAQERKTKRESIAPAGKGQRAADKEKKAEADSAEQAETKSRERVEGNEDESRGQTAEGSYNPGPACSNIAAGPLASGLRIAIDSLVSSSVVEPVRPAFSRLLDDYAAALLKKQ
ncbi:hypothetical protein CH63R_01426 [Colletotrichum higginsianum IMI 349063]|uniref:Uncharacterized protein n=1 Tax=Colletotrichum higginsianum (strain IMI 349063) TaxID=759273 RepID=A0A1B7YW23_COLHI|nr:hypothetical protein CH63R_01426 [Colletotrichum higginsianum IMI 349063]OBR16246.1 hypothetical protein CH63R_01426 [Colletotrichum higginsianum IMI 349063]